MKRKYIVHCIAVASFMIASAFIGGCAKKTVQTEEGMVSPPPEVVQPAPAPEKPEYSQGTEEPLESHPMQQEQKMVTFLEGRTTAPMLPVYFDFDRYDIRADQKQRIIGNAEYLKNNGNAMVRVEGNCDERGTNEYNMALGERRATSAKNYLINLGIPAKRIKTISYGEERPLNHGHDELAWSQNRRDDFVIVE